LQVLVMAILYGLLLVVQDADELCILTTVHQDSRAPLEVGDLQLHENISHVNEKHNVYAS
jgi:hypothetical protein